MRHTKGWLFEGSLSWASKGDILKKCPWAHSCGGLPFVLLLLLLLLLLPEILSPRLRKVPSLRQLKGRYLIAERQDQMPKKNEWINNKNWVIQISTWADSWTDPLWLHEWLHKYSIHYTRVHFSSKWCRKITTWYRSMFNSDVTLNPNSPTHNTKLYFASILPNAILTTTRYITLLNHLLSIFNILPFPLPELISIIISNTTTQEWMDFNNNSQSYGNINFDSRSNITTELTWQHHH